MKNKSLTGAIIAIIVTAICIFQTPLLAKGRLDSLTKSLQAADYEDSAEIYNEISEKYLAESPKKSIAFGKKALMVAERNNDEALKARAYMSIGAGFEFQEQYDLALSYYKDALSIQKKIGDQKDISRSLNNIGVLYQKAGNLDSAAKYYEIALNIKEKFSNYEEIAKTLYNLGSVYSIKGEYNKAIEFFNRLLKIQKRLSNKEELANVHNYLAYSYQKVGKYDAALNNYLSELKLREELNQTENVERFFSKIGKIYYQMQNYEKAIEYYNKALLIVKDKDEEMETAKTLSNLGNVYYEAKDFREALEYYKKSLKITEDKEQSSEDFKLSDNALRGKAILLNNLGLVYKNSGDYEKALVYCKRAIELKDSISEDSDIFYPLTSLAEIYLKLDKPQEALNNLEKSLDIAERKDNINLKKIARKLLYEVYAKIGDYEHALENHKKYSALKDSILNKTTNKIISEMQVKYETKRKEQENKALKRVNETQRNYFIVISALILIILGVLYSRYRGKQKANKMLRDMNKQIKKQHGELEYMFSQLQAKEERLREANATKDKFFSIIAHDLKNPLQAITLSADMLKNKYRYMEAEQLVSLIGNINNAGEHLSSLLENLLQWSRTQNGKIKYYPEEIDLKVVAKENVQLISAYAEKKGVKVKSDIAAQKRAFIDKNMISTVFRNLISNAVKFTEEDGEVNLSVNEKDLFYEVAVKDTGVGISEKDLDTLFRIDAHRTTKGTRDEKGTGLGLILCKEFVEMNGGRIWAESELGEGSTFYFTVPKFMKDKNKGPRDDVNIVNMN